MEAYEAHLADCPMCGKPCRPKHGGVITAIRGVLTREYWCYHNGRKGRPYHFRAPYDGRK